MKKTSKMLLGSLAGFDIPGLLAERWPGWEEAAG
jgi:hypothetical protein